MAPDGGRSEHEAHRVSSRLELLFDLTFVVAVSQPSPCSSSSPGGCTRPFSAAARAEAGAVGLAAVEVATQGREVEHW